MRRKKLKFIVAREVENKQVKLVREDEIHVDYEGIKILVLWVLTFLIGYVTGYTFGH